MIIHDDFLAAEKKKKRINSIFIPNDTAERELKPSCGVCHQYAVYFKDHGYRCPTCGAEFNEVALDNDNLESIHDSKPLIVSKKSNGHEKRPIDFPASAEIIKDIEFLPDGSSRVIEYD